MVTEGRPLAGVGALVTGGSGGIGRAAALHLARDGAVVTLMGRTQSTLDEAVASIEDAVGDGASVAAYVGDATMVGDVRAAVDTTASRSERFGICVAVVGGGGPPTPLLMISERDLME